MEICGDWCRAGGGPFTRLLPGVTTNGSPLKKREIKRNLSTAERSRDPQERIAGHSPSNHTVGGSGGAFVWKLWLRVKSLLGAGH